MIASSSVTEEAEQSEQLPAQPDARDAVLERQQLDVSPVGLHVGAHRLERALHPILQRDRMQIVDQQQRGDERILREADRESRSVAARGEQRRDDPLEPGAVHLDDAGDELLGELARHGLAGRLEPLLQLLDPLEERLEELLLGLRGERRIRIHQLRPSRSACA